MACDARDDVHLAEFESLRRAAFPKLIVHGREDILVRFEHGVALHEKIGGDFLALDNVGHGIIVQARDGTRMCKVFLA
jgi:pimeloyl-ACP methyl ester carboxylesterase